MWYVITKLVANCKDDVYLIKMVNFKVAVLFIKILTWYIYIYIYIYIHIYILIKVYL